MVERERAVRGDGRVDVPEVDGIERAAEDTDARAGSHSDETVQSLSNRSCAAILALARDFAPDGLEQRVEALPGGRRHRVERNTGRLQMCLEPLQALRLVERVDLVRRDEQRLVREPLSGRVASREQRELARDDVEVLDRIAARGRRHVDEMDQHLGALEMAQEPVPEAVARCAPSISPGTSATTNVRSPDRLDHAKVRDVSVVNG